MSGRRTCLERRPCPTRPHRFPTGRAAAPHSGQRAGRHASTSGGRSALDLTSSKNEPPHDRSGVANPLGARREATRQDSPPVTFFVVQADTSPTLRLLREILHRLPGGTKPDPPRSNDALQAKAIPFKKPARNSPELPQRASALTTIEENFRDTKDLRFGMGLSYTHIGRTDRRDRLLLIGALAQALLTLLGAAAEDCGLDRTMKANTVKRRTHSLFRQGCFFYSCIPMMPDERVALLMNSFRTIIA